MGDAALLAWWRIWSKTLQAALIDCLVPLLLLQLRRAQPPRVPLASLDVALKAAGGDLSSVSASAAVRLLAEVCPDDVVLHTSSSTSSTSPLPSSRAVGSVSLKVASLINSEADGTLRRKDAGEGCLPPCSSVLSNSKSLTLPSQPDDEASIVPISAQGKRRRQAPGAFCTNITLVERDLSACTRRMCSEIDAYAEKAIQQTFSEPPPLHCIVAELELPSTDLSEASELLCKNITADSPSLVSGATTHEASVLGFLPNISEHPDYKGQICHLESYGARVARTVPFATLVDHFGQRLISESVQRALQTQLRVNELFEHQAHALRAIIGAKRHLCLTTGTSSGKSLAFSLPILEEFRRDKTTRALILFPTKALAQDQLSKLSKLFASVNPDLKVCTFDGDTPKADRAAYLSDSHVFLTNPDMLHYTILAAHSRWKRVLENLRFVVLDEAHVYRAAFGTHVALLMRRFRRVLTKYKASPRFIACSATIINSGAFFARLLALENDLDDVVVVEEDTAGRGERQFCLWNPPLLGQASDVLLRAMQHPRTRTKYDQLQGVATNSTHGYRMRTSAFEEAAWLLAQAVLRGHRAVCFLQVRSMVEVVLHAVQGHLEALAPTLKGRVAAYRGGYTAVERRQLERRLFEGDLIGCVATNALELGIDIGDLDLTIHVGIPPSVASVWQQAGRAGRRGRASVAVLVAMDAPMEQHYCKHPREFFARKLEARLPDASNPVLLRPHILCAAAELAPLAETDAVAWFGEPARRVLDECQRSGRLLVQKPLIGHAAIRDGVLADEGLCFRHHVGKGGKQPKEELNIRDIDTVQFKVVVRGTMTPLETLDQRLAYMKVHPGAVYLNQSMAYFVEDLDLSGHIAWVTPTNPKHVDYYTECRDHSQVVIHGGGLMRPIELPASQLLTQSAQLKVAPVVHCGSVSVQWRMYGFRKKSKLDHSVVDLVDLSLPLVEYTSQAVWMDLPGTILQSVAQAGHLADRGGLHALEHVMISVAPCCCDVEVAELSCQHTRRDADPNRYLLFLFETQKGGAGASAKVFSQWEALISLAVARIEDCPCEAGCPQCILAVHCGEHNHGLDKAAALKIGRALGFGGGGAPEVGGDRLPCAVASAVAHEARLYGSDVAADLDCGRRRRIFGKLLASTASSTARQSCIDLD